MARLTSETREARSSDRFRDFPTRRETAGRRSEPGGAGPANRRTARGLESLRRPLAVQSRIVIRRGRLGRSLLSRLVLTLSLHSYLLERPGDRRRPRALGLVDRDVYRPAPANAVKNTSPLGLIEPAPIGSARHAGHVRGRARSPNRFFFLGLRSGEETRRLDRARSQRLDLWTAGGSNRRRAGGLHRRSARRLVAGLAPKRRKKLPRVVRGGVAPARRANLVVNVRRRRRRVAAVPDATDLMPLTQRVSDF